MTQRVEVVTKPQFPDPQGQGIQKKIQRDLGIDVDSVQVVKVYKFDNQFPPESLDSLGRELFADPVTQKFSSRNSIARDSQFDGFDWVLEVGPKPGVLDTEGKTASNAVKEILGQDSEVYTSKQYLIEGDVSREQGERIANLLANEVVQDSCLTRRQNFRDRSYLRLPKVRIPHEPEVNYIDLNVSDGRLMNISNPRSEENPEGRSLALNLEEMHKIQRYFLDKGRTPTDAELEVLAQTWSEHCKHKIFNSSVTYENGEEKEEINSLFDTYVKRSTRELQERFPWIVSVLWDNSGVVELNDDWLYCFKCETHNSPSNKEPFGGAATGIIGVYRDPMGTGLGCKLLWGTYGFLTGDPDYDGELVPDIHPRVLLEGERRGVEEANKHGVPTSYGLTYFDNDFMGKSGVYASAGGLIPREIDGQPGYEKYINNGDLVVMVGGRVGIDGIHGATESSMEAGGWITMGHVQMASPFQEKIMHDFLLEARDRGLYNFTQDNGAGGLSSSVGEMAQFSNGCHMDLEKVPLKYKGLDPWQILVSESQERMSLAVPPDKINELRELARIHGVEISVLGEFNNSGRFHVDYGDQQVANLDMDFMHEGVPQMELNARWETPKERGLYEPGLDPVKNHGALLREMLSRPNICSKEYIARQYDHEVQGTSVIKPYLGKENDVVSDASVIRPLLDSREGIAISDGMNPQYSRIDTYHMTAMALDEAIRRVLAVGGSLDQLPLNDNFIWPNPLPAKNNPDAEYKLAQLVRANQALYDYTTAFGTPCISGKDSMSMDGPVATKNNGKKRISAPPTIKFAAAGKIDDIDKCITMDVKNPGDLIYVLGVTKDELGGSEFYKAHQEIGLNVPQVNAQTAKRLYESFSRATNERLVNSAHGCYKGGLAIALAQSAFGGGLGMNIDLSKVPTQGIGSNNEKILYSESASRFVVTVSPENQERFEQIMEGNTYSRVGEVRPDNYLRMRGSRRNLLIEEDIRTLKQAWKRPYADR